MTTRQVVTLIDDLTGKELPAGGGETVDFSLDGSRYVIDVDSKGAQRLRATLAPYVKAARTIGDKRLPRTRRVHTAVDHVAVRAWAASNGIHVSNKGRIPGRVIGQFRAAGN
jgi:hypothetical protein